MAALEKGITKNGTGYSGKTWNILGQVYFPKAVTDRLLPSRPTATPASSSRFIYIRPRTNSSWSRMACWT